MQNHILGERQRTNQSQMAQLVRFAKESSRSLVGQEAKILEQANWLEHWAATAVEVLVDKYCRCMWKWCWQQRIRRRSFKFPGERRVNPRVRRKPTRASDWQLHLWAIPIPKESPFEQERHEDHREEGTQMSTVEDLLEDSLWQRSWMLPPLQPNNEEEQNNRKHA